MALFRFAGPLLNDLVHYQEHILGYTCTKTGIAVQFGQVARWITRIAVERVFSMLQVKLGSRMPSTTDSGPESPRVNDPVGKAVQYEIEIEELRELIDVVLAQMNAEMRATQYNRTPLQTLGLEFSPARGSVIPKWSSDFLKDPHLPRHIFTVTVRGNQETGDAPHVEVLGANYTNTFLRQQWSMVKKKEKLTLHIRGDVRTVRAFRESGEEFGVLGVTGRWSRSYHTYEIRQEIQEELRKNTFKCPSHEDPVTCYMAHLARKVVARSPGKRLRVSGEANKLAELAHGAGSTAPISTSLPHTRRSDPKQPPSVGGRWAQAYTRGKP